MGPSYRGGAMSTEAEFRTTKELVRHLLATNERCRNDDKYLTYMVFQTIAKKHGKNIFIPFGLWSEFPAFETVKRVRAYLQNVKGEYPPTDPEVIARRQKRRETINRLTGGRDL